MRLEPLIPRKGQLYCPVLIKAGTTFCTIADGIAKPTPDEELVTDSMAAVTPITWPVASVSTPPEFPGLIAASV